MSQVPGPSDYRDLDARNGARDFTATDVLSDVAHSVEEAASSAVAEIKERPYTAIAIAGGLAFTLGALWMLQRRRPQSRLQRVQSRLDQVMARLPELPSANRFLPKSWR